MYAHARVPIRIGIAGGGTDLPAWTKSRPGRCLSLAIATYTHAAAILRPDKKVVASYSQRDVAEAATEIANGLIRESALMHGFEDGFEVHILSEVTSRGSGLGVSSSIAVALAACFMRLCVLREPWRVGELPIDSEGLPEVASEHAWSVEIDKLRRPIGRQDHMAAAWGGLRIYRFEKDTAFVERTFSNEDAEWVAKHLAVIELQEGHDSRSILSSVKSTGNLQLAYDAVGIAVSAIESRDVGLLGHALKLGQSSKRGIDGAVPRWLSEQIEKIEAVTGILGCKVAGAGGGGHLILVHDGIPGELTRIGELAVRGVAPDLGGVRSEGSI